MRRFIVPRVPVPRALAPRVGWLAQHLARPYPEYETSPEQRRGMRLIYWDGILASASGAFYGEFVVLYMLALGATTATVGLRASLNSAAALAAPLIGAWLVARTGHRKRWVLLGPGGVARLTLLGMAAIPILLSGEAAVAAFMVLFAVQAFAGAVGMPAWNSLLGDICPLTIRGRFLGAKMMANNIATMAVLPLAGWLMAHIGGMGGYQSIWLLAGLVGFAATSMYWRVPESVGPGRQAPGAALDMRSGLRHLLNDRRFVLFAAVHFVWTFGIGLSSPFFTVHMVETLGFTADTIAYIATVTTLVNVIALRLAGELVDRYSTTRVMAISMLLVPLMPLFWIVARTPLHIGLIRAYGFLAWAGFRVGTTPLLLMLAPEENRAQYVAILHTLDGLANVIAPLPAAWLYANLGFTSNLIASAAGRMAGALMFAWMLHRGVLSGLGEPRYAQAVGRMRHAAPGG